MFGHCFALTGTVFRYNGVVMLEKSSNQSSCLRLIWCEFACWSDFKCRDIVKLLRELKGHVLQCFMRTSCVLRPFLVEWRLAADTMSRQTGLANAWCAGEISLMYWQSKIVALIYLSSVPLETVQPSQGTPDSSAKFIRRGRHEAATWDCGKKWPEGNTIAYRNEHSTNFASQSHMGRRGYTCGMTHECLAEASTMGTFCTSRGKQCLNIKECATRSNEPFHLWQVASCLAKIL